MKNRVSIKATKNGIVIHLNDDNSFEDIKPELEEQLIKAEDFFKKMKVRLIIQGKTLNKLEYSQLVDIIINKTNINCEKITANLNDREFLLEKKNIDSVKFYKGTIRAGQYLKTDKHLVVLGDVNPAAEIIAEGNVIVLGNLKGNVQAGYVDNQRAYVAAYNLQPTLISIGQVLGRADNDYMNKKPATRYPEIAYVDNGKIVIEPMDYKAINNIY